MRQCAGAFGNNNHVTKLWFHMYEYMHIRILHGQYLLFINPKYLSILERCFVCPNGRQKRTRFYSISAVIL
jgi:hypothetical protein